MTDTFFPTVHNRVQQAEYCNLFWTDCLCIIPEKLHVPDESQQHPNVQGMDDAWTRPKQQVSMQLCVRLFNTHAALVAVSSLVIAS